MAEISIYSGDFREAISELDALNANNALTVTAHDDIMNSKENLDFPAVYFTVCIRITDLLLTKDK